MLKAIVDYYKRPRPIDWPKEFANDNPLELEIGFGTGEYIVEAALQNPGRNFIGIEKEWERIHKTLRKIARAKATNVRVINVDAQVALERLIGSKQLAGALCLFPCPWPKRKHTWHRLFSTEFLKLTNSRLQSQGSLKIVTDHRPYADWILEQVPGTGFSAQENQIGARFNTKFERKWREQGQQEFYEIFLTKKRHQDMALKREVSLKRYYFKDFNPRGFAFENLVGPTTISFKELLYDETQKKAMLRLFVVEDQLTQDVWLEIYWHNQKWCLQAAPGTLVLPTEGVAAALERAYQAAIGGKKDS